MHSWTILYVQLLALFPVYTKTNQVHYRAPLTFLSSDTHQMGLQKKSDNNLLILSSFDENPLPHPSLGNNSQLVLFQEQL